MTESVGYLIGVWQQASESFATIAEQIADDDFTAPSLLPGWTVGDIVAHVSALETELAGAEPPTHEPDWASLPHAADMFSRYTEIGVDYRRGWSPQRIRAELRTALAERAVQLRDGPQDVSTRVTAIAGIDRSLQHLLRMRIYDIVIHEMDVRDALGLGQVAPGAAMDETTRLALDAVPYVLVKRAGAGPGEVLHLAVDPGFDVWVTVGEDGRAVMSEPGEPDVDLATDQITFLRLASGRAGDAARVRVIADRDGLAGRVIEGLNTAP